MMPNIWAVINFIGEMIREATRVAPILPPYHHLVNTKDKDTIYVKTLPSPTTGRVTEARL